MKFLNLMNHQNSRLSYTFVFRDLPTSTDFNLRFTFANYWSISSKWNSLFLNWNFQASDWLIHFQTKVVSKLSFQVFVKIEFSFGPRCNHLVNLDTLNCVRWFHLGLILSIEFWSHLHLRWKEVDHWILVARNWRYHMRFVASSFLFGSTKFFSGFHWVSLYTVSW